VDHGQRKAHLGLHETQEILRYSAIIFTLKFESLKDNIKVYNIIHKRKVGESKNEQGPFRTGLQAYIQGSRT
jgi:hypothetical protein